MYGERLHDLRCTLKFKVIKGYTNYICWDLVNLRLVDPQQYGRIANIRIGVRELLNLILGHIRCMTTQITALLHSTPGSGIADIASQFLKLNALLFSLYSLPCSVNNGPVNQIRR